MIKDVSPVKQEDAPKADDDEVRQPEDDEYEQEKEKQDSMKGLTSCPAKKDLANEEKAAAMEEEEEDDYQP